MSRKSRANAASLSRSSARAARKILGDNGEIGRAQSRLDQIAQAFPDRVAHEQGARSTVTAAATPATTADLCASSASGSRESGASHISM